MRKIDRIINKIFAVKKERSFMKNWKMIFLVNVFAIICLSKITQSQVIFEENFDKQPDWTLTQPTDAAKDCYGSCSTPSGWIGYYNGFSYCPGGPGSNNMYINSRPGHPIASSGTCRGGSGKCITFWDESCTNYFEDSDGQLTKDLGQEYPEIYVRFYIKFSSGYKWAANDSNPPTHKLLRVQHYCGTGSPYEYRGQKNYDCNKPFAMNGIYIYGGQLYYYFNAACEQDCNESGPCCAPYSWRGGSGWDALDFVQLGSFNDVLGDGNWHSMEFRYKANTNTGGTFNNNGIHEFWLDGKLKYNTTTFPYGQTGGDTSPRRYFRLVGIGGNNSNRWTSSCSGTGCEQWYAMDDIVVSTTRIGPTGSPTVETPDSGAPSTPKNLKTVQ